jgi:hypothetical protein
LFVIISAMKILIVSKLWLILYTWRPFVINLKVINSLCINIWIYQIIWWCINWWLKLLFLFIWLTWFISVCHHIVAKSILRWLNNFIFISMRWFCPVSYNCILWLLLLFLNLLILIWEYVLRWLNIFIFLFFRYFTQLFILVLLIKLLEWRKLRSISLLIH